MSNRKILNESIVKTRAEHTCHGCGRKFPKNTQMNSAACKFNNNLVVRKYFCEACHHIMVTKNITIDKFWYGELFRDALNYETNKKVYNMVKKCQENN